MSLPEYNERLKRKYPSGKQISTLRRMVREGIAFADVRVFYYALPDRTMRVDFRTPCGTHDTSTGTISGEANDGIWDERWRLVQNEGAGFR